MVKWKFPCQGKAKRVKALYSIHFQGIYRSNAKHRNFEVISYRNNPQENACTLIMVETKKRKGFFLLFSANVTRRLDYAN